MKKFIKVLNFIISKAPYPLIAAFLGNLILVALYFAAGIEYMPAVNAVVVLSGVAILWAIVAFIGMIVSNFIEDIDEMETRNEELAEINS